MKRTILSGFFCALMLITISCEKGDLSVNPNAAGPTSLINTSLFVNRLGNEIYNGGGTMDLYSNYQPEGPWNQLHRWNQYFVSNYNYYWGNNFYTWSNTATQYGMLKYVVLLEDQINKQGAANVNKDALSAVAKFYKAFSFIWYSERVGDIPMSEAGNPEHVTPKFDSQHDVYKNSLAILDSANTLLGNYIIANPTAATATVGGDIYGLTNLQWQKLINTYRIRVLISLSKRADDNADLNIKEQFAAILGDAGKYPIMTGNADNLTYKYNLSFNPYPLKANGNQPYALNANISDTYLNITTAAKDPRTFLVATPAPAEITAGKTAGDFTAYVGSDMNTGQATLLTNSTNGMYSFPTYRYFTTANSDGSLVEPYVIIGYSELCFNIAEGIQRGWATGTAASWYDNGVNASLATYKITDGQSLAITDKAGVLISNVTVDLPTFKSNITLSGDNATALQQILEQKYVAMYQNSGFEAYFNFRRTGFPAFAEGGPGIGTANSMIPLRFLYANDEKVANSSNYQSAIQSQYGGTDDVNGVMWLIK